VNLWQMHGLTNPAGWKRAMGPGGTLEAFVEARAQGLVRFLGVTGHGLGAPVMHNTYFYEPLEGQGAIDRAVHWVLGHPDAFLLTAGDKQVLPRILDAAGRFEGQPSGAAWHARCWRGASGCSGRWAWGKRRWA
jgi:hypothetical protein